MTRILSMISLVLIVSQMGCSHPEPADENAAPPTGSSSSISQPSAEMQTETPTKAESGDHELAAPSNPSVPRVPRDFPLPVVDGAELLPDTPPDQEGKNTQKVIFKSDKPLEELAAFYEKALTKKGLDTRKTTQQQGDEKQFLLLGFGEEGMAGIMIANKQSEKSSTVVLNWAVGKREPE